MVGFGRKSSRLLAMNGTVSNVAMCANYQPPTLETLMRWGFAISDRLQTSGIAGDIYPLQAGPVLTSMNPHAMDVGAFGLVPHWAEPKLGRHTYNARSETVASKPSFRSAWKNGQLAAIPVQSFYEPCYESGKAVRHRIARQDGKPFFLAGLWERRMEDPGLTRLSFTMLTIPGGGHPIMQRMHGPDDEKRSVVVLEEDAVTDWLTATDVRLRADFLRLYPAEDFAASAAPRPRSRA